MRAVYSKAFVEQALVKVFSRGDRTVSSVADDLNLKYHTLKSRTCKIYAAPLIASALGS